MKANINQHITVVFAIFSLTLLIIDKVNEAMYFINNNIYKNMLIVYFVYELVNAIYRYVVMAKNDKL